jgi:hypothetical protein
MKLYAGGATVIDKDNTLIVVPSHWLGTTKEEAEAMIMNLLLTKYPKEDGYVHHHVALAEVPREDIKRVAVAQGIIRVASNVAKYRRK